MSYYGSWKIDDALTFCANTHRFDTGAATDADAVPDYRVYENETSTPILTGSMALLDSANTAGFYSEAITLSAANGFEKGKCYSIYITATVNSVTATTHHNFQIEAAVDANTLSASCTEPSAVVAASPTIQAAISWLLTLSRNKITQTSSTQTLKADDGTTTIATSAISDDGTTFTRNEFS